MNFLKSILARNNGIQVFEAAFPDVLKSNFEPDAPLDDKDWIEKTTGANRVSDLPVSDEEKLRAIEDLSQDSDWKIDTKIDLLAWYCPFAVYGPTKWGIYFDTSKMDGFVAGILGRVWLVRPDIKSKQVEQVVWDQVRRHEIEHCVQELVVALGVLDSITLHSKSPFEYLKSQMIKTEALASHFETVDTNYRPGANQSDRRFIESVLSSRTRPGEYDLWNKIDIKGEIGSLENVMNGPLRSGTTTLNDLQRKVRNPRKAPFLDIPIYLV